MSPMRPWRPLPKLDAFARALPRVQAEISGKPGGPPRSVGVFGPLTVSNSVGGIVLFRCLASQVALAGTVRRRDVVSLDLHYAESQRRESGD